MRNRIRGYLSHLLHWLRPVLRGLAEAIRFTVRAHRDRARTIPIEVLVGDRARRRTVERHLCAGLRRLRHGLGRHFPQEVAVIVQQVICTDRQIAGCYQLARRSDSADLALIRLALQVDGRELSTDELLSILAEQCIGLAVHQAGSAAVLVPVELEPERPSERRRVDVLRPDPLAPTPASARTASSPLTRSS